MSFTIRLLIWFKGKFVGSDSFGNRYYEEKPKSIYRSSHRRRWVIYKSDVNVGKIPPEWHAWLHYRADVPLNGRVFDLDKEPQSVAKNCKPEKITEDNRVVRICTRTKRPYQPWIPNE